MENNITKLNKSLKKDFFGIDRVIDEICTYINPWYHIPDSLIRPQIINLWGMTGTGKTSLVRQIAQNLNRPIIEIDLGEFTGSGAKDFGWTFFDKYYDMPGKPAIILIDEFHIARTVDEEGSELDRTGLRNFWSLLSDGKIVIGDRINGSDGNELEIAEVFDGTIEEFQKDQRFLQMKTGKDLDEEDRRRYKYLKNKSHIDYLESYYYFPICKYLGVNIKEFRKTVDADLVESVRDLKKLYQKHGIQKEMDFSKALIFISGNLDEIYYGSDYFDPDMDLNLLQQQAEKLTVSDVKSCLTKRFRIEQIGRLGNNHVIYPVLGKDAYYKVINKEAKRINKFYKKNDQFNYNFKFEKTVSDILFKEGVFPAQGVRSINSTIGSMLEPAIVNFIMEHQSQGSRKKWAETVLVDVEFDRESRNFLFKISTLKDNVISVPVKLKIDDLRKPMRNRRSVAVSIHEAGHITLAVVGMKVVPSRATAFSTTSDKEGVVEVLKELDDDFLRTFGYVKSNIAMSLGGYVAEKMMFGVENMSTGASKDIQIATEMVVEMIESTGYPHQLLVEGFSPINKSRSFGDSCSAQRLANDEFAIRELMRECMHDAERILTENKEFLFEMAELLITNSMIFSEDIKKVMKKHKIEISEQFDYVAEYDKKRKSAWI